MKAIRVDGISKEYEIGAAQGAPPRRFLALDGVRFDVESGEVVGIIGRNGAGKSTLLKILSGITDPTAGRAELRGRVCSLLEVGTGFHPELTGRENVYLNGTLLGMRRREIRGKFDDIVAFSEVERFIDTPVKHYSSGMYVRLAFSVAAHLDPEILIVDEVLAVGDARFQMKCIGRIGEIGREGRTVLVVSHNMQVIQTLCGRGIWLDAGKVVFDGSPRDAVVAYAGAVSESATERAWSDAEGAPGSPEARLLSARVRPADAPEGGPLTVRTPFRLSFRFRLLRRIPLFYVGYHLRAVNGEVVFRSASPAAEAAEGVHEASCLVPGDLLNNGKFAVDLYFMRDGSVVVFRMENALVFDVHDVERDPGDFLGDLPGPVRPRLRWDFGPAP